MEQQVNVPVAQRLELEQILGDDTNEESYSRMPISSFGQNLLKSMGWNEGKGIGKNPQNALLKPIEYVPNYDRAGLGARKDAPSLKKKRHLNDNTGQPNGNAKNYGEIGKEKSKKVEKNSKVKITGGKYEGLKGVVTEINESKKECYVELEINEELVRVDLNKVKLSRTEDQQDRVDFEMAEGKSYSSRRDSVESSRNSSKDGKEEKKSKKDKKDKKKKKKEKRDKKRLKWISTHILVKVVSKKVRDGKIYEKKMTVSDILDEYSFSVIDDKGNHVDELREKDVETVMPKQNGLLKVLVGDHKGKIAVLLERDKKKNRVLVQFVDTMELGEYTQDDCSAYVEKV